MAALAGANTTTLTETIPTESIAGLVLPAPNLIRVYQAFTWQCPGKGASLVWPQLVAAAVTGSQTEADEFTATDIETVKESVTPAMVGKRSFHSEQVDLEGSILTPQARVDAMAMEVENRIDKDVLGLFVGAAGSDYSGFNLDLDKFDTALAAFHAVKPTHPRICFVGSTNQIRDLRKAIRNSAGGALLQGAGLSVFNGLPVQGYCGEWQGVEIFQGNTTQADATNDAGGFVSAPPLGTSNPALGILPGAGLGVGVWRGLKIGAQPIEARVGVDMVVTTYYGAGITADNNVWSFFSKKAA
jgi:hypothetical protein